MRPNWLGVAGALVALTAMTGCGDRSTPTAGALPADQMVFMVLSSGGMAPSVVSSLQSPALAVYGSGRVLMKVLAPALQLVPSRYEAADAGPVAVENFVSNAGTVINAGTDFGTPRFTDLPTTTVLLHGDGQPQEVQVYAFDEQFEGDLTPAQRDARANLRALIAKANTLTAGAARTPYVPDRITVNEPLPSRNQEPATSPWPGPPPSDFLSPTRNGRVIACGELSGADAQTVYRAALDNPGARWLVDGTTRVLGVNPVPLPGRCP